MTVGTHGLSHIGLRVTDLARAKRFYVDTLGFQFLLEMEEVVSIDANGVPIALLGQGDQARTADRFDPHLSWLPIASVML